MTDNVLTQWGEKVLLAVADSLSTFLEFIPNIVGALTIFVVGWILARIVKRIVVRILETIQLEPFAEKVGISNALNRAGATITPNELLSEFIRWSVVLVFLIPTVETLGLSQFTILINNVLQYIPNVLVAALILMVGTIVAELTSQFVKSTAAAMGTGTSNTLEVTTKYAIMTFVTLAALSQLGIAQQMIITLFTGFVAMLAIAGGLAFGLGGKEVASDILEKLRTSLSEKEF